MDDASRPAGSPGSKVILLQEQCAFPGMGEFASDGDAVDAATDDDYVESSALK